MKKIAIYSLLTLAFSASAFAQVYVQGHTRADGTYVAPHYRSAPDSTKLNNYSTQGNVNPWTGKEGTVNPYNSTPQTQQNWGRWCTHTSSGTQCK
jgi:hypothetical protein